MKTNNMTDGYYITDITIEYSGSEKLPDGTIIIRDDEGNIVLEITEMKWEPTKL
jgi:hypothetical protein